MYLKPENRAVSMKFQPLNMYLSFFFITQMIIYFLISEILKTRVSNRFFSTQYPFVFVLAGKNTKWILCSRKIGVKCAYCRFLKYKIFFHPFRKTKTFLKTFTYYLQSRIQVGYFKKKFLVSFEKTFMLPPENITRKETKHNRWNHRTFQTWFQYKNLVFGVALKN